MSASMLNTQQGRPVGTFLSVWKCEITSILSLLLKGRKLKSRVVLIENIKKKNIFLKFLKKIEKIF